MKYARTRNFRIIIFLVFIIITSNSCQLLRRTADKAKALSQCKFELQKVDKKVSFTQHTGNIWNYVITAHIAGINQSVENISLGSYRLDLYANDKWVTDIATQTPIALKPHETTMIEAKAIFSPSGAWSIFWKKLTNQKIEYRIKGTFYLSIGSFNYPFAIDLVRWEDNPN